MARRKRRIRIDRILVLLLVTIFIIFLIAFIFKKLLNTDEVSTKKEEQIEIEPYVDAKDVETTEGIKIDLLDYKVYVDDTDDIGFSFIVAELKFTADKPISFDLSYLQTSEKKHLNDVSKYINVLLENNYKVNDLNIVTNIESNQNELVCNIFIPFETDGEYLNVYNSLDSSKLEFNLDRQINYITSLRFENEQIVQIGKTNVEVSSSHVETMMMHNGEEYDATAYDVYAFEINVTNLDGDVMITEAKFANAYTDEPIVCLSSDYESVKSPNVVGKKLTLGNNGALFFEMPGHTSNPNFEGDLILYFSNTNNPIKIKTTLD